MFICSIKIYVVGRGGLCCKKKTQNRKKTQELKCKELGQQITATASGERRWQHRIAAIAEEAHGGYTPTGGGGGGRQPSVGRIIIC